MTDYYNTLGVHRGADQDEIKQAFRRMAAQHHPDRGGDTAMFQEVQAAYATLSDPEKRQQYDNPQPQGFSQGFHFDGNVPPGFEQFFSQAFGQGGNPFFGQGFRQPQRNRNLNLQTTILQYINQENYYLIGTIAFILMGATLWRVALKK